MTFKLEVGKTYYNRGGKATRIISCLDSSDAYPYLGDDKLSYKENGRWFSEYVTSNFDLVSEVSVGGIKHSHYKKDVTRLSTIDIYRVLELFEVRSHAIGHAIKKLLMAGNRGAKGYEQDIQEAIDSLNRELQMKQEDNNG